MTAEKYIAQTYMGLENILAAELRKLNLKVLETRKRAVVFLADTPGMIRANLMVKTALHILRPIAAFNAQDTYQLHKHIKRIPWEKWLKSNLTFAIRVTHTGEHTFENTLYVLHRVKDGIVDRFRSRIGGRPSVDRDNPDCAIQVHLHQNRFTVTLDSSGNSLHKRGYRTEKTDAPLNEVLAAGLVGLTGWKGETPLIDPMCGSGTIITEAALKMFQIPANSDRSYFPYFLWNQHNENLTNQIKKELKKLRKPVKKLISGYDQSNKAIETTLTHFRNLKLFQYVLLQQKPLDQHTPIDKEVTLLFNPPYNHRLKINEKQQFTNMIKSSIHQIFPKNKTWIFAPKDIHELIESDPLKSFPLSNGGLDTVLNCYKF